jgi:threonine dehydrogenase-like Zn-dependent dehydrogenase
VLSSPGKVQRAFPLVASTLLNAATVMRAAVLVRPGEIVLRELPLPEPGPGQVRLRLEGCGVCASNLEPFEGKPWFTYPFAPGAPGHEGWGTIDALGPGVTGWKPGCRVATISQHAYATHDLAAAGELIALPAEAAGQPFPAEPLACTLNVLRRSAIQPGDNVAVVGIGFLGALLVRLAANAGARVIALGRRGTALDAACAMGAEICLPLDDHWKIIAGVKELTGGVFCDVVIEATGRSWPLDLAAELTRERGRLVVAGYHQDGPRQINMQLWNWRGLDVINAHERDPRVYLQGMRAAVAAVAAGELDPRPLYTHTLPLAKLAEAFALARDRPAGFMKALVTMD